MFTLDYKETTVNPLSDKVVSGACVCLKIFVHVSNCAIVTKWSVSYLLMHVCYFEMFVPRRSLQTPMAHCLGKPTHTHLYEHYNFTHSCLD